MFKKYLIAGLAVMLGIGWLLTTCHKQPNVIVEPQNIPVSKQQKKLAIKQADLLQQIDAVDNQQVKLTGQITNTRVVLEKTKIKSRVLKEQIQNHLKQKANTDTSTFLGHSGVDNISYMVNDLLNVQTDEDSIQQQLIQKIEQQVLQKQTVIQLQQQQYITLKAAFDQSIAQQNNLLQQNKQFKKQRIKQKIQRIIFAALVILASTIAVKQILK
jgi:hypothetical protein